jgi:5-dehydro-2-deoxygluconokinase
VAHTATRLRSPLREHRRPVPDLDLITVGRANLDLYAQQPGVEFGDVRGWDAMVGGSPTNVALAGARLGLRTAVLTAVGGDLVGDWVVESLTREGVDTRFVARKHGPHTSLALRAQLPPDHPLAFYRHDPADVHVTARDAAELPLAQTQAVLFSADALARGTTAEVCRSLIAATAAGPPMTYLDLDFREVSWDDRGTYAAVVAPVIDKVDVVLGNEAEFATLLRLAADPAQEIAAAVGETLPSHPGQVIVVKQGERGAVAIVNGEALVVDSHPVTEASSIGAGDSFAAGLIRAHLLGADWQAACEFASACAAITVSRLGCSSGFPRTEEVDRFLNTSTLVPEQAT